jgi:phage recombination protein Bet
MRLCGGLGRLGPRSDRGMIMADIIALQFSNEQVQVMKKTIASGVSDNEFFFFLEVCKARGLNPFNREIYAIPRSQKMTIQVSIDGMRILAERSGKYRGQIGPQYCAADGQWRDEWLLDEPPVAARVGVLRSDFDQPIWAVARYKAYVQASNPLWKSMPEVMCAKCAESLALRKAFPQNTAGLYTNEEMMQADGDMPRVKAPSLKVLHIKGHDAGLWADTTAFYLACSDILSRHVTPDNARSVTPEERLRIDVAINEKIAAKPTVTVEIVSVEDAPSIDELSQELASQRLAS